MIHASPPAPQTPRARRHDANEARIVDAALTLVAEAGLEGLSMARLAQAVDYTPGALYRYFGSKDALLAALVGRILAEIHDALAAAVAALPANANALVKLFTLARAYGDYARARPHGFGLLALTMAEPRVLLPEDDDAGPVTARVLAALELLAAALVEAEAGELLREGDVVERTLCLFATLQGLLQLRKRATTGPVALDVDRLAAAATRTLLLGWGAPPRAVDAAQKRASLATPGAPS